MNPLFLSSADLFADLNRMQALMERLLPGRGLSIRSQAAGFPVLNVGTTPTSVEVQALAPGLDPSQLGAAAVALIRHQLDRRVVDGESRRTHAQWHADHAGRHRVHAATGRQLRRAGLCGSAQR